MKCRIFKLCLFLLLGAIINVAVAWGCAVWSGRFASVWIDSPESPAIPGFVQRLHDSRNLDYSWVGWDARSGYRSFGFDIYTIRTGGTIDHHLQTTALVVGWPQPCLWASYTYYIDRVNGKGTEPFFEDRTSGILLRGPGKHGWWIPGVPIWPDFAINTIFYAVIIGLPFGAFALRRRRRIKRGLCPACAYPVGQSAVCSECGKPTKVGH
jgi:hypothetical protein